MKKLIVIVFVLLTQFSRAQNPVEKTVYYIPVQNNINSSTMPLEYNTQTTRLVQVLEVPNVVSKTSIHADSVQTSRMESSENYKLKATMNHDSASVDLEYKLELDAKASIIVSDLRGTTIDTRNTTGRQDQLTLLTRDWVPGVYVASLKLNGKLIESVKFTVVK
ncbi:MAG: hypothetical protein Q8O72_16505 [Bacteroidales bacterium]|nr:hypothetical protein [Bacteroidales bacterium]